MSAPDRRASMPKTPLFLMPIFPPVDAMIFHLYGWACYVVSKCTTSAPLPQAMRWFINLVTRHGDAASMANPLLFSSFHARLALARCILAAIY